jgi:hypothetical protein
MTNGEVFKAATLVNEMVASAMKADPTKNPATLIKTMAASATAKLTDASIDTAAMMGMSAANAAIMQAQMATMQAKAGAMKSVADAVAANVASASQAGLTPADAAKALTAALAGTQANDVQTMIAKAQMAQDTQKQMFEQMDKIAKDASSTGLSVADLAAKMAAMAQGLDAVRVQQESGIQTAIIAAGGDATKIADAMKQASGMIIGSAPALLTSVTGAKVSDLTSDFMNATATSIAAQFDPAKMAAAVTAAGGDPTKIDFTGMGLDPTKMATDATTVATQAAGVKLTPPSALANYPALATQVVGMVISRATAKNYLASTKLQDWVNAIGTALAANNAALLNPGSVGETIGSYFFTKQPDLTTAPGTLTLTIGAATTFTPATTPITTTPPAGSTPPAGATSTTLPGLPTSTTLPGLSTSTTASTPSTTQSTTSTTVPTQTGPTAAAGVQIYAQACGACHGGPQIANSNVRGRTAGQISAAITGNIGGMGGLSGLPQSEIAAIAAALQ